MTYGYIRVSSDKQTVENQRFEVTNFCKREKMVIDGWIEETISGTKAYDKRELGKLLKHVRKDDIIICSEISRLGRSLFMVMEILSICMKKECKVYTIKDNYRLGDDIQSKVLAFAFGLSAEIERNLISMRTKEALARLKAEGKHVGRKVGSLSRREVSPCYRFDAYIVRELERGDSVSEIARRHKLNYNTLRRYISKYLKDNDDNMSN